MANEADVFISYKRSDRERVSRMADALQRHGLSVWLDARLEAGESFDVEITRHLRAAKVVLVCWSKESVESQWVRAEATEGREAGKLVAVLLEPCRPYPPFNIIHMEDLSTWRGEADHPEFLRTVATIARKAGQAGVAAKAETAAGIERDNKRESRSLIVSAVLGLMIVGGIGTFVAHSFSTASTPRSATTIAAPRPPSPEAKTTTPIATTSMPAPPSSAAISAAPRRTYYVRIGAGGASFDSDGAPTEAFVRSTTQDLERDRENFAFVTI